MRPVRLRVSVSGGNWLWWSPLSRPLHILFGSTPNYGRRLPNGPGSSTPKRRSGRVAYEGRCARCRPVLLVCGAEVTLSRRRLRRINLDLGTQRAWFTKMVKGESESNWLHTEAGYAWLYFVYNEWSAEFVHSRKKKREWRPLCDTDSQFLLERITPYYTHYFKQCKCLFSFVFFNLMKI